MDKSTKWNRKQTKVAIIHSRSFQYTLDDGAQYRLLERINKLVEGGDLSTFSPERSLSPPGTINASSPTSFHFLDLRPSRTSSNTPTNNASSNVVQSMSLHGEGTTAIGSPARIRRANNLIKVDLLPIRHRILRIHSPSKQPRSASTRSHRRASFHCPRHR